MGRAVPTCWTVLEALISDWQGFRKALRKEDLTAYISGDRLNKNIRSVALIY